MMRHYPVQIMKKYVLIYIFLGLIMRISCQTRIDTPTKDKCYLTDIKFLNYERCTGVDFGGKRVNHQGSCITEENKVIECIHGHWSGTGSSVGPLRREKRFWGVVIGFVGCLILCGNGGGGGGGGRQTPISHPPSFSQPCRPRDLQENYNIGTGQNNVIVNWTVPSATDEDNDIPRVVQVAGGENGGRFDGAISGKTHSIIYKATDSEGLTDHCYFNFTVTVLTCDTLPWFANGKRYCDNKNILGSSCQYTCNIGYMLNGNDTVVCENEADPSWSAIPICEKIMCSAPQLPEHATVQCSDQNYGYQTVCTMACDNGFALIGAFYIQCQANGSWSNIANSLCVDNTPPTLSCLTPQIFYADRGKTSTLVKWQLPEAFDKTDEHPSIVQTGGPIWGTELERGTEVVKYTAVDVNGNKSPECLIELRIEVIMCVHPMDKFDDAFLRFDCSTPRIGYIYGTSCNLSCNSNLPLNGSDVITCEDNGNFEGNWSISGGEPFCREISCPDMDPPINGALVYDTVLTRPMRQLICNEKYDIPPMSIPFNGIFFCTDNGNWVPLEKVPNCVEPRDPRFVNLPAEIFYYGGKCGTEETMAQIKSNFQALIQTNLDPYFGIICPPGLTCIARDIVITCGPIESRKKRSQAFGVLKRNLRSTKLPSNNHIIAKRNANTHSLRVKFNIVTSINETNTSFQDTIKLINEVQLQLLVPVVNDLLQNGTFDIDNYVLQSDNVSTADYGTKTCDDSYVLYQSKCKPCSIGYFFNKTSNACDECPVGQYRDNESDINCLSCPDKYSTRYPGSTSRKDCLQLCMPGAYSPDTFETCSSCRHGYYQDGYGQTTCKQCPDGTTTVSTNSSSRSDCKNFDVFLKITNGDVAVAELSETLTNFTFMFWTTNVDRQTSNASMTITSGGLTLINVLWNNYLRVQIKSLLNETIATHNSSKWSHIAISWDTSNSQVRLYCNGKLVKSSTLNASSISSLNQTSTLTVTSNGKTGILLTGLHLIKGVLPETAIAYQGKSCHTLETNDLINEGSFVGIASPGISLVVESSCYAYDECLLSPCNGHICTNGLSGYTCTCQRGWSGTNCTTPPDFCIENACQNAATCVSASTNYTCNCVPGYSGHICEISPVNGGWSDWSESVCSKTCGSGIIYRTRQCDSPTPDVYGVDCVGAAIEIKSCNTQPCPVCKEFNTALGTVLKCSTDDETGSKTCTMECEDGKILPPGLTDLHSFTCGPSTNYEWDNFENPPSCVDPKSPENIHITVNVTYTTEIGENAISEFKDHINDKISQVPCFDSANCETDIDINQSIMTIWFSINTTGGQDLQYNDFISTGESNDFLQEVIDAVNSLEQTGRYIQNHTDELFDVTVNNTRYTIADENPIIYAGVSCTVGFVAIDGICVECPAGTFYSGEKCSFCQRGKYQPKTGQSTCIPCPPFRTTDAIGSTDSSQCKSYDACLMSPCNGHVCTNRQDGYTCTCDNGWSGTNCDTPPDRCINNACVNGATCISLSTNYMCECTPGYSGQFCEISPSIFNGGWSEWSETKCSKTCGTGVITRTRKCDNPVPDTNGADCVGEAMETITCNTQDCIETSTVSNTTKQTTTQREGKPAPVDEKTVTLLVVGPVVAIIVIALSVTLVLCRRFRHNTRQEKSNEFPQNDFLSSSLSKDSDIGKGSEEFIDINEDLTKCSNI
ncbi:sushi, von Willebrand factor type A, EGF and pentraxin domain-containing protein 1-like isoform X2 [Ruditapes philippinarum]|uniref:sushi, von Willebrand factor type A, EGF and pentraxin domain-containing protein 1-like isoform X2 n=1 Tax=Ruditapes philippinarum TaxID=129788 RepID=UPI00295B929F|nr:sushi, von Willebrand factor type A, EGF and pentraxin domain-containing protein 1-like isoform X2 [Ruditapes philippinarum]